MAEEEDEEEEEEEEGEGRKEWRKEQTDKIREPLTEVREKTQILLSVFPMFNPPSVSKLSANFFRIYRALSFTQQT